MAFVVGALLASITVRAAEIGVTDTEVLVGQTAALTGPVSDVGHDLSTGAKVYFDELNARGGVHGRRIRLITVDDAYQVALSVTNARKLLEEDHVFAFVGIQGTPHTVAVLPMLKDQVPVFGPFSGAEVLRKPPHANLFNIRASFADETEKLVEHLETVGIKRIAVVFQDNAFGRDGLTGAEKAVASRALKLTASISVQSDASDVPAAVSKIHGTQPEAVILITVGLPTPTFIKAYNKLGRGTQFYTLSVMATQATITALGSDGIGVVVATVVPFPWSHTSSLAKEYQAAMAKAGVRDLSFVSLEGYINAKVFADALQLAGKDLTRAKLIAATEKLRVDYGGFRVGFSSGNRQGSRTVELALIGSNQRFMK
jgi:ABC-type branched-subunit amino acid transport system substrate-binding protein